MLNRLWTETTSSIVSSELVLISALMVCGLVTSLTALRDALVGEIDNLATAISELDQTPGQRPDEIAMERATCTQVVGSVVQMPSK